MPTKRTKLAQRVEKKTEFAVPDLVGNSEAPTFAPSQIRILVAALDITLLLGEVRLDAEGAPKLAEICRIRLSPQHAKALAGVLSKNVLDYESQVGPIILPEAVEEDAGTKKTV